MVKKINSSILTSTTGHGLSNMATTGNIYDSGSIDSEIIDEIKLDIDCIKEQNSIFSNCLIDMKTQIATGFEDIKIHCSQNFTLIEDSELEFIYEDMIKPYIDCEIDRMGGILDVIRVNNIITDLIANATDDRSRLILNIFKDIMTVLINARNDKTNLRVTNMNLETIKYKYQECTREVISLKRQLEFILNNKPIGYGKFKGDLTMKLKKLKPTIYIQARFDIDRAWYIYLHGDCIIDPQKYQTTISYVRSFGTLQNAYCTLINLLDEKYKSVEDDIKKIEEEEAGTSNETSNGTSNETINTNENEINEENN